MSNSLHGSTSVNAASLGHHKNRKFYKWSTNNVFEISLYDYKRGMVLRLPAKQNRNESSYNEREIFVFSTYLTVNPEEMRSKYPTSILCINSNVWTGIRVI
ncbi:hypothetical protein RB195_021135 [Necator americanus]|uniref:PiggyBac transposable element-derived protein domain-containing protein n=1 Tax=Necator americanus TaxID=51031 RepID=A0ABR1EBI9_NECAM